MERVYCAVYTRKSTNEGLDGAFTSLDAQREAALNYIASQKTLGWTLVPEKYDDGGFTGANIERPALQKLLDDIKRGGINCVVVYKVDRLSRSLTDFAKLLEFFEEHNVTFVSITQHFNTTNSMGRLTLNILLSFAQFEREIISERTKDKMAAARKKGRFVGGMPLLGYDIDKETKSLRVNKEEAKVVREVFDLYLEKRALLEVAKALNERGRRTKRRVVRLGRVFGGKPFAKNTVAYILNNCIYMGKVKYAGAVYDGIHEAIIPPEVFEKAQTILAEHRIYRIRPGNAQGTGLLRHILWCAHCKTRMTPTYASKKNFKYRYYVCQKAHHSGYAACPTKSVNAELLEKTVIEKLQGMIAGMPQLRDRNLMLNTLAWALLGPQERRRVLNMLVKAVEYQPGSKKLAIELNEPGIADLERELA